MTHRTASLPSAQSLLDFSNHGTLPFVARTAELARLAEFWRGTADAQGLRAALVTGESGIGKSRLLEELVPGVTALGGVVVHAKLYPGSSRSIAPILARAVRFSGTGRNLLKKEPDDDIESVITTLQRLARLRPVLLIIEDFHILSGEPLGEFTSLLEALAGEGISILALARPMDVASRGVLERYLVEEIELAGLTAEDIATLWSELFHTPPEPGAIALLAELTLGNLLALRSALRGVLKSGALARDAAGIWRPAIPLQQFGEALARNIRLLSEGMAAHLTDEERHAAGLLATIGEVFAREAGQLMVAPGGHLIETLLFKGILVEASSSILPLPGGTRALPPLAFTHTLLHRHMVENASVDADRLARVIVRGLPLYSVLPWELLASHAAALGLEREELREWIDRSIDRAVALDGTPDWELAMEIIRAVEVIFEARAGIWDADEAYIRARILITKLDLNIRRDHSPEFHAEVARLLDITSGTDYPERLEQRLCALKFLVRANWRTNYPRCLEIWDQAGHLLAKAPALRFTASYIDFVQAMASASWAIPDTEMLRRIETWFNEMTASNETSDDLKERAWRTIPQYFLTLYGDAGELGQRIALVADLERRIGVNDITLQSLKVPLFESIGMPGELRSTIGVLAPRLREQGLLRPLYQCLVVDICQDAWFATGMGKILEAALRLRREVPEPLLARFDLSAGFRLERFAVLRGEYDAARTIMNTFIADPAEVAPHLGIMLAAGEGRLREALPEIIERATWYRDLVAMARVVLGETGDVRAEAIREARVTFTNPFLSIEDLVGMESLLDMIAEAATNPANADVIDALRDDIRRVLGHACGWLSERSFFGVMEPMLARYGQHLDHNERERWRKRAATIRAAFEEKERSIALDTRVRLTMLGTIEVHRQGDEPVRPRGARLRAVLGLMVANKMLEKPLSYREFCQLAAGGEEDPERARKMASMAILRLRESIGLDMIRTVGETPELDPAHVQVDLLDAHRLLREAVRAARRGDLRRALPLLLEALELTCAEVPFPTLYDDFFEALREDFDFTIREAVIEVGGGLLREGDPVGAEDALQRGFNTMPEDETIAALLRQALEQQGKRAEGMRIGMNDEG